MNHSLDLYTTILGSVMLEKVHLSIIIPPPYKERIMTSTSDKLLTDYGLSMARDQCSDWTTKFCEYEPLCIVQYH